MAHGLVRRVLGNNLGCQSVGPRNLVPCDIQVDIWGSEEALALITESFKLN